MWIDPKHKPMYPYIPIAYVGNGRYAVPYKDDPLWQQLSAEARAELFWQIDEGLASVEGRRLVWASPHKPTHYPCAFQLHRVLEGCGIE